MAVKKAKDASFKRKDSAYAASKSAIQKVKNADPLNAKEEQEQEEGNASVDPANYLSKKEKKEWKRLSYTAKQRYIRQAERQLKRQKKRNGIAKTEPSSVQEKEKQAAKIFSKERKNTLYPLSLKYVANTSVTLSTPPLVEIIGL